MLWELGFIGHLGLFQLQTICVTFSVFNTLPQGMKNVLLLCFLVAALIVAQIVIHWDYIPATRGKAVEFLATACNTVYDYPRPVIFYSFQGLIRWMPLGLMTLLFLWAIPIALGFRPSQRWQQRLESTLQVLSELIGTRPEKTRTLLGAFIEIAYAVTVAATTAILIQLLINLESDRQALTSVSSGADLDAKWGFGQVFAVLLWLPLLHDILTELMDILLPSWQELNAQLSTTQQNLTCRPSDGKAERL